MDTLQAIQQGVKDAEQAYWDNLQKLRPLLKVLLQDLSKHYPTKAVRYISGMGTQNITLQPLNNKAGSYYHHPLRSYYDKKELTLGGARELGDKLEMFPLNHPLRRVCEYLDLSNLKGYALDFGDLLYINGHRVDDLCTNVDYINANNPK